MSGMTSARRQVAEDLQAIGLTVKDHVPEKVVPPLVLFRAGEPMLEEAETMSGVEMLFRLGMLVIVGTQPNREATEALEETVEKVLYNLGDWTVERVGQPFYAEANGFQYPTVEITVSKTITIEGGE